MKKSNNNNNNKQKFTAPKLSLKEHKDFLYSALKGEKDKVSDFIRRGVDINYGNSHGETAIYLASGKGNHEMVKLLLDHGADGTIITASKQTVLHNASVSGSVTTLQVFKEKGISQLNFEAWEGSTELLVASRTGKPDMIKYLLDNGCHMNFRDLKGTGAVHQAVRYNNLEALKVLCSRGAKLNERSYSEVDRGECPLHMAMREDQMGIIEILMNHGAKITCCVSCRRGKACPKMSAKMLDWYHSQIKARRRNKGTNRSANNIPIVSSTPYSLDCPSQVDLPHPLSDRGSDDEISYSDSPPPSTVRRSFLKRFLSSSFSKKKKENC